ncbi:DUF4328 domain-containing protein [bacterium]|nr:DUF4328 domain-containing protein [bacterium]
MLAAFLGIYLVTSLILVATSWLELEKISNGTYDEFFDERNFVDRLDEAAVTFSEYFFYVVAIIWGVWVVKTCKNAWLINSRDGATAIYRGRESFTPGWTVGWYFIPILSLWKPYQAMTWIRDASQKPLGLTMGKLLGLWWTFWVLSAFSMIAVALKFNSADTTEKISAAHRVYIAASPLDLLSTIFAALVVLRLTKIQKIRAKELSLIPN